MILEALWFFLPAGVANMAPVIAQKLLGPGRQIHPALGSHKTVQGLVSGVVAGQAWYLVQVWLAPSVPLSGLVPYETLPWFVGGLFGAGALVGDAIKSFVKRQRGIPPGRPWVPFDQVDYIIGAFLFVSPFVWVGWSAWLVILLGYSLAHVLVNLVGFRLGLKRDRF